MTVSRPRAVLVGALGVLLALLGMQAVAPSGASAATPSAVVDDGVVSGTNHFSYTGNWIVCGGCNPSGAYQNSFRYSPDTGSTATFTFAGTQAVLFGVREPWGGIAAVRVDGGTAVDLDYYATTQSLAQLYATPVLTSGTHTVSLTVTGRSSGTSRSINIDRADVYSGGTPTTSPPPTTTTPPPPGGAGIASLTFDDGQIGQYRNARPVLLSAGLKGTFYVISDGLGWGTQTNMSPTEARQLVADGDEIGSHTRDHSDLTSLSSAQVEAEFADAQSAIRTQVGVTPTTCAYPYGTSNATVRAIAAKYFTGCRGTSSGSNPRSGTNTYDLLVFYVHTSTTAADVRAAADAARSANRWVIFVYHGVGSVGSNDDVTTSAFQQHVQALKDSGIPVRTVSEALAQR